jgi:hypothetical protein
MALARTSGMNPFTFSWPVMLIGAGAVVLIGVVVAWGVIVLERRNRAEMTAEQIQQAIGHALAREPLLASASILPVADFPVAGRPTLELTGYVPSTDARARAVRVAERELGRLRPGVQVIARLDVFPALTDRRRPA